MRHTKIVATLGPASTVPHVLAALVDRGVDVFRLNFSHGTHESHGRTFHAVRDAAARAGRHIAILQDLSGPKIRTTTLRGGQPIDLHKGDELRIGAGAGDGGPGRVFTPYADLIAYAEPGSRLLLDDGKIELRVRERRDGELVTEVVNGGKLGEHKGINAPGVKLPAAAVTAKDEEDLKFGLALGVDLVALSFVQSPDDCHAPRRTRAEVSDAATAVDQGVDAIMLAGRPPRGSSPSNRSRLSPRSSTTPKPWRRRRRCSGRTSRSSAPTASRRPTGSTPSAPSTAARCARRR